MTSQEICRDAWAVTCGCCVGTMICRKTCHTVALLECLSDWCNHWYISRWCRQGANKAKADEQQDDLLRAWLSVLKGHLARSYCRSCKSVHGLFADACNQAQAGQLSCEREMHLIFLLVQARAFTIIICHAPSFGCATWSSLGVG